MKILSPKIHGMLDYVAALALITAPLVTGLTDGALWMSIAAGAGLILYSLITDYSASVAKLIPLRMHLILDTAAGLAFLIAPFVFGWAGAAFAYYLVMGSGVLLVVLLTASESPAELDVTAVPSSLNSASR